MGGRPGTHGAVVANVVPSWQTWGSQGVPSLPYPVVNMEVIGHRGPFRTTFLRVIAYVKRSV